MVFKSESLIYNLKSGKTPALPAQVRAQGPAVVRRLTAGSLRPAHVHKGK